MRRELITQFGFDVLVADGQDPLTLKLTHDVIPVPRTEEAIQFGSAFCLVRDGVSTLRVLVGREENLRVKSSHAWRHLGLKPISNTSEFGQSVYGKKVGEVVSDAHGSRYRIVSIFCPDVSRDTPYTPPERLTHFRQRFA